jgi:hypothetical protein
MLGAIEHRLYTWAMNVARSTLFHSGSYIMLVQLIAYVVLDVITFYVQFNSVYLRLTSENICVNL